MFGQDGPATNLRASALGIAHASFIRMGTVSSAPLNRHASLLVALLLLACEGGGTSDGSGGAAGTSGAAGSGSGGEGGKAPESVVWVGAHPDDELYAAPWLAWLCIEQKANCTFVVMTRGESGNCSLGGGCAPDLATVRDSEMAGSAALFGAKLVHWDLGDSKAGHPPGVVAHWGEQYGSSDALVSALAALLSGADRVITFDPRHGDSCHHDHRAAGGYAIAASESIGLPRARVSLVASKGILNPAAPTDGAVWAFDGNQLLASSGQPAWGSLVDVLEIHSSQFTPADVASVVAVPAAQRRTWFLDLNDAVPEDPKYAGLCPE